MFLCTAFDRFDPLTGRAPRLFYEHFSNIAYRSREIVGFRNMDELRGGVELVAWMLAQMQRERREWGSAEKSPKIQWIDEHDYSAVGEFFERRLKFDIEGQSHFEHARWPDLFAVLALALVGMAHVEERRPAAPAEQSHENQEGRLAAVAGYAIDAMEAVQYAERLQHEIGLGSETGSTVHMTFEDLVMIRHSQDAIAEYIDSIHLKREFIEHYLSSGLNTPSAAAESFYQSQGPAFPDISKGPL